MSTGITGASSPTLFEKTPERPKEESRGLCETEAKLASGVEGAIGGVSKAARKTADGTVRAGRFTGRVLSRIAQPFLAVGRVTFNVARGAANLALRVSQLALTTLAKAAWFTAKCAGGAIYGLAKYTGLAILGVGYLTFKVTKEAVKAGVIAVTMAHLAAAAALTLPFSRSRASDLFAMAVYGAPKAAYAKA